MLEWFGTFMFLEPISNNERNVCLVTSLVDLHRTNRKFAKIALRTLKFRVESPKSEWVKPRPVPRYFPPTPHVGWCAPPNLGVAGGGVNQNQTVWMLFSGPVQFAVESSSVEISVLLRSERVRVLVSSCGSRRKIKEPRCAHLHR